MAILPIEILYGTYLGLIAGIVPAIIAGSLAFLFRYITGVTIPALGVVILSVAIAGVNGGLLGLIDPTIISSPRLVVATIIVMMLSFYSHSQGDKLGATIPKKISLKSLKQKTISTDFIEMVEGIGQVTITPKGTINDIEGYPPLPNELREEISKQKWRFPADLPLSEIENRLEERLRTEYNLFEANVSIDDKAKATISASPPSGDLSKRVSTGNRAVSIETLVPTGISRGDIVQIKTDENEFEGKVVSARTYSNNESSKKDDKKTEDIQEKKTISMSAPTTDGGEGRITLSLPSSEAVKLLKSKRGQTIVKSKGTQREFELISLLRKTGKRIRKITVQDQIQFSESILSKSDIREKYNIEILGVRKKETENKEKKNTKWIFSKLQEIKLLPGDELFIIGEKKDLDSFEKTVT